MTTEERFDQLEGVMVESLRKQDRIAGDVANLREEVSELNVKVVRIENKMVRLDDRMARVEGKLEDYGRNILELRRDTELFQQETTAGLAHIVNLIQGLGK